MDLGNTALTVFEVSGTSVAGGFRPWLLQDLKYGVIYLHFIIFYFTLLFYHGSSLKFKVAFPQVSGCF